MSRRNLILAVMTAAAAIGAGLYVYLNAPQRIVRKRMREAAETASFDAETGLIAKGLKARKLEDYLAPLVSLKTPVRELNGQLSRAGIVQIYKGILGYATEAEIRFGKLHFAEVSRDRCVFDVDVSGTLRTGGSQEHHDRFRAEGIALKIEGKWQFSSLRMTDAR
jgi:hypothetical protein